MDDNREVWIRRSDAQEERVRLSEALKGWWKLAHPRRAWQLYRRFRATNEASRKAANEQLLKKRLADPALGDLNADQRRAVIVQEDRTLIVAGAGTGCCLSLSPVGTPRHLTGLFRRRIAWDDGTIREVSGAGEIAFTMNRCG